MKKIYGIGFLLALVVLAGVSLQSRLIEVPTEDILVEDVLFSVQLNLTVFLQGPYNSTTMDMDDNLKVDSLIPLTEPYTGLGFTQVGTDTSLATTQAIIDANGIVDWVWVELRDATSKTTVVATQPGLLKSNGTVVNYNNDAFQFINLANSGAFYFVAVRHRNHLGIMTADSVVLTTGGTAVDMTSVSLFGTNASATLSGVGQGLWGGDVNMDGFVRYNPKIFPPPTIPSDIAFVLSDLLNDPNGEINSYVEADVNMDGFVRYNPKIFPPPTIPSDIAFILSFLGNDPNGQSSEQLP